MTDLDALEAVLAKAMEAAAKAGWLACRKQVYAMHKATYDERSPSAQSDTEGKMGAYARGRISEAKSMANALGAIGPENCDELAAAIVALHNAAPALIAEHRAALARVAELEAEVAQLRGPVTEFARGYGPGDGDSKALEPKP